MLGEKKNIQKQIVSYCVLPAHRRTVKLPVESWQLVVVPMSASGHVTRLSLPYNASMM